MLYESLDEMENEFIRSPFYPGFIAPDVQAQLRQLPIFPVVAAAHSIFQCDALAAAVEKYPSGCHITMRNKTGQDVLYISQLGSTIKIESPFELPKRNLPKVVCDTGSLNSAIKCIEKYTPKIREMAEGLRKSARYNMVTDMVHYATKADNQTFSRWDTHFENPDIFALALDEWRSPGSTLPLLTGPIASQVQTTHATVARMMNARQTRIARAETFLDTDRWRVTLNKHGVLLWRWTLKSLMPHIRQYPFYFGDQIGVDGIHGAYVEVTPQRGFTSLNAVPQDIKDSICASMTMIREIEGPAPASLFHPAAIPEKIMRCDPQQILCFDGVTKEVSGRASSNHHQDVLVTDFPAL